VKGPLESTRRRYIDATTGLKEITCESVDCLLLAQDRVECRALVKMVMNFRVPGYGSGQTFVTNYKATFSSTAGYYYQPGDLK
jgi:hypothetical protein